MIGRIGLIELGIGLIELGIGLIELRIGLIDLGIVLVELVIGQRGLIELSTGLIELGIGLIELGIGLMELGISLRINNARRTVLARVSGLVTWEALEGQSFLNAKMGKMGKWGNAKMEVRSLVEWAD